MTDSTIKLVEVVKATGEDVDITVLDEFANAVNAVAGELRYTLTHNPHIPPSVAHAINEATVALEQMAAPLVTNKEPEQQPEPPKVKIRTRI